MPLKYTFIPTSIGTRIRYQIDRDSDANKQVYKQRTANERINSQAVELGIERPKLRNGQAIANLNTLIYVLIDPSTSLRAGSAHPASRASTQDATALRALRHPRCALISPADFIPGVVLLTPP